MTPSRRRAGLGGGWQRYARRSLTSAVPLYDSTPGRWEKTVAALRDVDLAKETAEEAPAGDADVRAFPVQTKVTRLLTAYYRGSVARGTDCVVYVNKTIEAKNDPLIGTDLEAQIASAIKSLHLSEKYRIDFHLIPASPNRAAGQRNRDAIYKRFLGKESQQAPRTLDSWTILHITYGDIRWLAKLPDAESAPIRLTLSYLGCAKACFIPACI